MIVPLLVFCKPASTRSSVVLPQPLGPSIESDDPCCACTHTSVRILLVPISTVMSMTCIPAVGSSFTRGERDVNPATPVLSSMLYMIVVECIFCYLYVSDAISKISKTPSNIITATLRAVIRHFH